MELNHASEKPNELARHASSKAGAESYRAAACKFSANGRERPKRTPARAAQPQRKGRQTDEPLILSYSVCSFQLPPACTREGAFVFIRHGKKQEKVCVFFQLGPIRGRQNYSCVPPSRFLRGKPLHNDVLPESLVRPLRSTVNFFIVKPSFILLDRN